MSGVNTAIMLLNTGGNAVDVIERLSDQEKVQVREATTATETPRNLWFNYQTQRWID